MNALAILAERAEAGSPEDFPVTGQPLGVIDIGSNSGRLVVVGVDPGGHLRVLADARSPLRLARDVGTAGRLSTGAIDRTVLAVRDFLAVARGAGAKDVVAVATSAVRESANAPELLER